MNEADDTDAIIHMYHHHGDGEDHADGLLIEIHTLCFTVYALFIASADMQLCST